MGSHSGMVASYLGLQIHSLTLCLQNAYFTELGVDPSPLMAVDLMHDAELGFGKGTVLHILRLLLAEGGNATEEFDTRSALSVMGETFF